MVDRTRKLSALVGAEERAVRIEISHLHTIPSTPLGPRAEGWPELVMATRRRANIVGRSLVGQPTRYVSAGDQ